MKRLALTVALLLASVQPQAEYRPTLSHCTADAGYVCAKQAEIERLLYDNSRLRQRVTEDVARLKEYDQDLKEVAKTLDKCALVTRFLSDELEKAKHRTCS